MRPILLSLLALSLFACKGDKEGEDSQTPDDSGEPGDVDGDMDGWLASEDCDDADPAVHPEADEVCNDVDDDCDGLVDDDTGTSWYTDADGDGYGADASVVLACEQPAGFVAEGGDCDDADPGYNPGALETDCEDPNDYNCDGSVGYADEDGDGYAACADCDDADGAEYPGAVEVCDGDDDDCDTEIDEAGATGGSTWYRDADGDGYGSDALTETACEAPEGYVGNADDCDDGTTAANPGADELCDDLDNDCDELVDEAGALDESTWYADDDEDGYGDPADATLACEQPEGYVAYETDCDDTDPAFNPSAVESCDDPTDYNCDGSVGYEDADGDGWAACEECDDTSAEVRPDADELCNEVDDDCDAEIDEDEAVDAATWYADADGDRYGDPGSTRAACEAPEGHVVDASDCDDTDDDVFPGADELCNDYDDDCDAVVDEPEALDAGTWYTDEDDDGYGTDESATPSCEAPAGAVSTGGDCDDEDEDVHPGVEETCDDVDEDCDGYVDDGAVDPSTFYADEDGDGYGDPSDALESCDMPSGYVADDEDCDDGEAGVNPGADESCNEVDDDCDGATDEAGAADEPTWYADTDGDGYGDASDSVESCAAPSGYLSDDQDCDDADASIYPGAEETCNGYDDDCDGEADESGATEEGTWYRDADGDGYGDPSRSRSACERPSGYVKLGTDCDDTDDEVYPGAEETCDGEDEDCDGEADEEAVDAPTWYADADGDGAGDASVTASACEMPSGYVSSGEDCDDADGAVYPGADELCNEADDDCDGNTDEGAVDRPTWYRDSDGDGYGGSGSTRRACDMPSGYAASDDDCEDDDASVYPGAPELCGDGAVNDCEASEEDAFAACELAGAHALEEDAWAVFTGAGAGDYTGWSVAGPGDLNGDGLDDVLIGASRDSTEKAYGGAVYLFEGPVRGDLSVSAADAIFRGEGGGDEAGQGVAGMGDADGDGYRDILVTAPKADLGASLQTGTTYLVLGPYAGELGLEEADAVLTGEVAGDVSGRSVSPAEDWDGDGVLDLAIGAAGDDTSGAWSGKAYVVLGPVSGTSSLAAAALELSGEATYDYAGRWLAGGHDLDGDGSPDLVVGANGEDAGGSSAGAAYVIYGPLSGSASLSSADAKLTGEAAGDQAGRSVAFAEDTDGDGLPELLVGAWASDRSTSSNPGSVYLFRSPPSGAASLSTADAIFVGAARGDNLGMGVDGAGDVDGDGTADLLFGAQGLDTLATNGGGAFVFYGPVADGVISASSADLSLSSSSASANAGYCVAGAGDVNGDGRGDLLLGAYKADITDTDAGAAFLIGSGY